MFKNYLNNFIFTFIFLLSTNEFFLFFGKSGRTISLSIGFINLIIYLYKYLKKYSLKFIYHVLFYLILLLYISYLNEQQNLTFINIIFDVLAFILILFGRNFNESEIDFNFKETKFLFYFIFIFYLISAYKFYFIFQNLTVNSYRIIANRNIGDDSMNPIGVAYNHACLFIIFFWLYFKSQNTLFKFITFFSAFYFLLVVFMTLSRGVIIYLTLIFILILLFKIKNTFKFFFKIKWVVFIYLLYNILIRIDFFNIRISHLFSRFDTLFSFFNKTSIDRSSIERQNIYKYFYNHYIEMFLGMFKYNKYPHNIFLEIFMRWGVFGFLLLIILFKLSTTNIKIFFFEKMTNFNFLVSVLFIYSFLQSTTSLSLEMNKVLWFTLGYFYYYKNSKYDQNSSY